MKNDLLSDVPFEKIVDGLYRIGSDPPSYTAAYFALETSCEGDGPTSIDESWRNPDYPGWYIFTTAILDPTSGESFLDEARNVLPLPGHPGCGLQMTLKEAGTSSRSLVWLSDVTGSRGDWGFDILPLIQLKSSDKFRRVYSNNDFSWGNLVLRIGVDQTLTLNVGLDDDVSGFKITTGSTSDVSEGFIRIIFGARVQTVGYYNETWNLAISLIGPEAGVYCFNTALDPNELIDTFHCGFKYFYPSVGSGASVLSYPFLEKLSGEAESPAAGFYGFNMWLNPLVIDDPDQTRLSFDMSSSTTWSENSRALLLHPYFTPGGTPVGVAPVSPQSSPQAIYDGPPDRLDSEAPGFAFCKGPSEEPDDFAAYLAPVGTFEIRGVDSSPEDSTIQIMPGVFGNEYLKMSVGSKIEFMVGSPAWAPGFAKNQQGSPDSITTRNLLEQRWTTSWVQYKGDLEPCGYFGQPSQSSWYANSNLAEFPQIVNSCLSDFTEVKSFPFVPYAHINGGSGINGQDSFDTYKDFENAILAPVRASSIGIGQNGPLFSRSGSQAFYHVPAESEKIQYAFTPQGFIVQLNDQGAWERVIIARSPVAEDQYLEFNALPEASQLNSILSGALIQNQLFLVISSDEYLDNFGNEINVGGFEIKADLQEGSLLIVKYNTASSIIDLVDDAGAWVDKNKFIGNEHVVQQVQDAIWENFEFAGVQRSNFADASGDDRFVNFRKIITEQEWTGVLILNGIIDGSGMPSDLQILLGGIDGPLHMHHLGVQSNNLSKESPKQAAIKNSSLFGVIKYLSSPSASPDPAEVSEYYYLLQHLTVVFSHSVVTQFDARVDMTINKLFGRAVTLTNAPQTSPPAPVNTISINGIYQNSGGVGTVRFAVDYPFIFEMDKKDDQVRVIEKIIISGASLNPDSTGDPSSPGSKKVKSIFGMTGMLWFASNPFNVQDGLDLFSYGNDDAVRQLLPWEQADDRPSGMGLGFSNLMIRMACELDMENNLAGERIYIFDPSELKIDADASAIRPGSLFAGIPMQISSLQYDAQGLAPITLAATPINCLELEMNSNESGSPAANQPSPWITSSPAYALEYDLPLGSLGSLSGVHAGLTASFYLGWGPSSYIPDNDAAAIFIKLPALDAGYKGFDLQGVLKTTFGDANLTRVNISESEYVYALMFNNIALSVFGFSFPPGVMVNFVLFAGNSDPSGVTGKSNIAWYLTALPVKSGSPSGTYLEDAHGLRESTQT